MQRRKVPCILVYMQTPLLNDKNEHNDRCRDALGFEDLCAEHYAEYLAWIREREGD